MNKISTSCREISHGDSTDNFFRTRARKFNGNLNIYNIGKMSATNEFDKSAEFI